MGVKERGWISLRPAFRSLADDLEYLVVELRGLPRENDVVPDRADPRRFPKLVDLVFGTFALAKVALA